MNSINLANAFSANLRRHLIDNCRLLIVERRRRIDKTAEGNQRHARSVVLFPLLLTSQITNQQSTIINRRRRQCLSVLSFEAYKSEALPPDGVAAVLAFTQRKG